MNKVFLFSLLFVIITSFTFQGKEYEKVNNPNVVLNKIKTLSDKTNSIVSDFNETKHLAFFKEPQISKGKFYYAKNNKMRWEQTTPSQYLILINGESLKIIKEGKEQNLGAGKKTALKINDFMMSLIQGEYQNSKDFNVTCYQSSQKYLVKLIPITKPLNKVYLDLELFFSKKTNRLESIVFNEKEGDKRIVTFVNQKYNTTIDNNLFTKL